MPTGRTGNDFLVEHPASEADPYLSRLKRWSDFAQYLRSRWRRMLAWTVAGALLAALLSIKICKFEATAQIMPPDSSGGGMSALALPSIIKAPGLSGLAGLAGDLLGAKSTGALFAKVLQSRTVEDRLIDQFDLRKRYHTRYWEDARTKLQSRTVIQEDKKSGVISISVRDADPEFAAKLTGAYVQELDRVMLQVATSAARREREFIEQRLQDEKKILDDSEQRFSHFASSSMTLDIPQQTRVMVEASARLQGELIAARAELQGLEQLYTDENTRVRTVRARVNELQRALDKLNTGRDTTAAEGDSSNPYPSVKSLPLVGLRWTDLYRNTKIHETVYELLTQQYEVARIQEAREIPTVKLLDAAVVPEKRHPDPVTVIGLGAIIGIILAGIGQFLQYRWINWDVYDPRRVFLASILNRQRRTTASSESD